MIAKYLFNWSNVAVVPALLALAIALPGLCLNTCSPFFLEATKNALSKNEVILPDADA